MAVKWNIEVKRTDNGYYCDPAVVVSMQVRSPLSDLRIPELAAEMYGDGAQRSPAVCQRVYGVPHIYTGNRRKLAIEYINERLLQPGEEPWKLWFVLQNTESVLDSILLANTLNEALPMNALDKAHMYSLALREGCLTQEQLAQRVGKTAAHVSQHLSLLRLGEAEQRAIAAGKIGFAAALDLMGLSKESREAVVASVEAAPEGMTGQEVKALAAAARKEESAPREGGAPPEGGAGKIVMGLGGLRKVLSALAERNGTFLPIANVIDSLLRGQISEDDFEEEWATFVAKLHFDYLEKLKADGKVRP